MSTITRIPASEFGDPEFAKLNLDYFHEYVTYRVHGYAPQVAFIRVFGNEQAMHNGHLKIHEIEHNPWVRATLAKRLHEAKNRDLWNDKIATLELLSVLRDPAAKHPSRVTAIKELNVLHGITITDEKGNTRRGMSLDEFYKAHGTPPAGVPATNPSPTHDPVDGANEPRPTTH
ncbi:hypothetical protein [Cupriavidus pauculus]|uniref:Uncharacterized protein n=1 Tax=Cupriavidus pauculus TaxID=82633 RepID=A0A2N5C9N9_9BURK|nr:hypothetical protein [Cupriavidus pauculus]PLP98894.1 hypothetical protein CYJ10_19085 [Cupriavidus pauculus]